MQTSRTRSLTSRRREPDVLTNPPASRAGLALLGEDAWASTYILNWSSRIATGNPVRNGERVAHRAWVQLGMSARVLKGLEDRDEQPGGDAADRHQHAEDRHAVRDQQDDRDADQDAVMPERMP